MKKQYMFILLIISLLYLIFLVLDDKYDEYRVYRYTESINETNILLQKKIDLTQDILKNRETKAYKNKILKSQQWMRNPGERVVFLIEEEKYNKYTQVQSESPSRIEAPQSLLDEKSLIESMSIYQKWMYFIFGKDTR